MTMSCHFWLLYAFFLAIISCCDADSRVIGPHQPVTAVAGSNVVLPCHLDPETSAVSLAVEWTRPELKPQYVHLYRNGHEQLAEKNSIYSDRTSLFLSQMNKGNVSLKLYDVKLSDEGKYTCFIPTVAGHEKSAVIHLVVDAPVPEIAIIGTNVSGVVLQCKTKVWSPKLKLEWTSREKTAPLDGVIEMVESPDGVHTLTSQIVVKKTLSNRFTCKVQQRQINKSAQTEIHVPDEFFHDSATTIIISVFLGLTMIAIGVLCWYICRLRKINVLKVSRKKHSGKQAGRNEEDTNLDEADANTTLIQTNEGDAGPPQNAQPVVPMDVVVAEHSQPMYQCNITERSIKERLFTITDPTRDGLIEQVARIRSSTLPATPVDDLDSPGFSASARHYSQSADSVVQVQNAGRTA